MGFFDIVKILFLPALIASAFYFLLAYVLLPFYRRHHERYSQYLPISTLQSHTSSLRSRITDRLSNLMIPSSMRWRREIFYADRDSYGHGRNGSVGGGSVEDYAFGEEEGESMVGFGDPGRLERGRDERGGRVLVEMDSQRRLSRELEEGFKDDSSEDGDGEGGDGRGAGRR